jgi:predicted kinase
MHKSELPHRTVIFVGGAPATGKSVLIEGLRQKIAGICLVSKDDIGDALLSTSKHRGTDDLRCYILDGPRHVMDGPASTFYHENLKAQILQAMLNVARTNLGFGLDPIIESNYISQVRIGYFQNIVIPFLSNLQARVKFLFCHAPRGVIAQRLEARNALRDTVKLSTHQELGKYVQNLVLVPEELAMIEHLKLDGTASVKENVAKAITYLRS